MQTRPSPADVDDRPGAAPPPSPWALRAEFSITVGDCSTVQVKFIPEGLMHRFEFRGAVSETGYYCEFISAQTAQGYRSPSECATALASGFHAQWMKAKTKPNKRGTASGDKLLEPVTAAQPTDETESAEGEGAIARSVESMLPEILALDKEPDFELQTPTEAQWQAAQEKLTELLQALKDAQVEISQLKAERDALNVERQALHTKNSDLHNEIAVLKVELAALLQQ